MLSTTFFFNILPLFTASKWMGLVISLVYIANCGNNAFVFLMFNVAIRNSVRKMFNLPPTTVAAGAATTTAGKWATVNAGAAGITAAASAAQ